MDLTMLGELFDPQAELLIEQRIRPHWAQDGAVVFITFRTHDSIPADVLRRWEREKSEWMRHHGQSSGHWSDLLPMLSPQLQHEFQQHFNRCREMTLDDCHGDCVLRHPACGQIVANSLLHFDGQRCCMGDFVVMPNHVHLLAAFGQASEMRRTCSSWMTFTATQINRLTGREGKFWQQEPFDHLVRSPEQYEYLRTYIADNPVKAKLKPGEFIYRRYNG